MDGDRIVDLLKHLSSSSPRRGALRWLAASSLGGAFAQLLGLDSDVAHARRRVNRHAIGSHHRDRVEADRKKKKKKKKKPEQAPPAPSPPLRLRLHLRRHRRNARKSRRRAATTAAAA
jgi:hypothetical protein